MPAEIAPKDGYLMLLHDGEPLPEVKAETGVRPGTLAIRYPSRETWFYTGREWSLEPVRAEITLVLLLDLMRQLLTRQEQLLELWKQQVTEGG